MAYFSDLTDAQITVTVLKHRVCVTNIVAFQYKDGISIYRDSHHTDNTAPYYFHDGDRYPGKAESFYWDGPRRQLILAQFGEHGH